MLLFPVLSTGRASAVLPNDPVSGDWSGKVNGDYTHKSPGYSYHIKESADISFTVPGDGNYVKGNGKGWAEYEVYSHNVGDGDCTYTGRGEAEFEIYGTVDREQRTATIDFSFVSIRSGPGIYSQNPDFPEKTSDCDGTSVFAFHNFGNAKLDLTDGSIYNVEFDPGDGYTYTRGTNDLVIHGPVAHISDCPLLTITPTMPPTSDPRSLADPTDSASYRFQVAWHGKTPTKVYFDIEGGSNSVSPSFAFNPANMQSSPISVLMDVATHHADVGDYPLTVDAWVIDPDTQAECHAAEPAQVTLVVSEEPSRPADLGIVQRFGDVKVEQEKIQTGDEATIIQTGADGAATINVADNNTTGSANLGATIQLGGNTKVKQIKHAIRFDDALMDDLLDEELKIQKDRAARQTIAKQLADVLKDVRAKFNENIEKPAEENLSCVFAWLDEDLSKLCTGQEVLLIEDGDLYYKNVSKFVRGGLMMDSDSIIIPTGTELTLSVHKDDSGGRSHTTTATLLEGSAIVIDLASEKVQFVKAGERYTMMSAATTSSGKMENINADKVPHWWQLQVGDYATSKGWDNKKGPVNRTNVFTDQDTVYTWFNFTNVQPPERHITFKYYRPDGSSFWNNTITLEAVDPPYTSWSSYTTGGGYIELPKFPAENNYGRWRIDVYDGDQFVQQMPFYVVKYGFVDNQSAKYALEVKIEADDPQVKNAVEGGLASVISDSFAGRDIDNITSATDIEWIKATVVKSGSTLADAKMQPELKVKGSPLVRGEQVSLFSNETALLLIPTVGIDGNFTIPAGSASAFPSQIALGNTAVDIDIGGSSSVKAYEFTGSKKTVADKNGGSSDVTVTAHYEKYSGMLIDYLIRGRMVDPQAGAINLQFGLKATEMSIPTTLTLSSPAEISQNQDVSVTGAITPPVNEGNIVLTYQKNGTNDGNTVTRTVPVINGNFSDKYKMEKDGIYLVTAKYSGSGAYLASDTGAKTLTVTPSGCLIATAAFGSELTPQVQFLRSFRDDHILSTAAGSSFMDVFNKLYYSFSPSVADYERGQPWLQQAVRIGIYPLLGILTVSEKAYSAMPGEYGAVTAGIVASSLIGAAYVAPVAIVAQKFTRSKPRMNNNTRNKLAILVIGLATIIIVATASSMFSANKVVLMITTSLLVLTTIAISAFYSSKLVQCIVGLFFKERQKQSS